MTGCQWDFVAERLLISGMEHHI